VPALLLFETIARYNLRRREFFRFTLGTVAALIAACDDDKNRPRESSAHGHPEPRPDITAANVLSDSALTELPDVRAQFAMVREVPVLMDSIRCHCNCAVTQRVRSLLACFEQPGMARDCELCLEQAARVYQLHKNGKSVKDIRRIVDAAFS
jgi:hypothetical protein